MELAVIGFADFIVLVLFLFGLLAADRYRAGTVLLAGLLFSLFTVAQILSNGPGNITWGGTETLSTTDATELIILSVMLTVSGAFLLIQEVRQRNK